MSRGILDTCVLVLVLRDKVVEGIDGLFELGNSQESRQIGGIGGDDNKAEEPPGSRNQTSGEILRRFAATLWR